jgi:hypothetical protein
MITNTNEAIDIITKIAETIRISNDKSLKDINTLELILLNLRIQEAHINEVTGIVPIINELERTIHNIKLNTKMLISENRAPLIESITYLNKNVRKE